MAAQALVASKVAAVAAKAASAVPEFVFGPWPRPSRSGCGTTTTALDRGGAGRGIRGQSHGRRRDGRGPGHRVMTSEAEAVDWALAIDRRPTMLRTPPLRGGMRKIRRTHFCSALPGPRDRSRDCATVCLGSRNIYLFYFHFYMPCLACY